MSYADDLRQRFINAVNAGGNFVWKAKAYSRLSDVPTVQEIDDELEPSDLVQRVIDSEEFTTAVETIVGSGGGGALTRPIVFVTDADSPINLTPEDSGKTFIMLASANDVTINLPLGANCTDGQTNFHFQKESPRAMILQASNQDLILGGSDDLVSTAFNDQTHTYCELWLKTNEETSDVWVMVYSKGTWGEF